VAEEAEIWPAVNAGTSVSGLIGGLITLLAAGLIGYCLKGRRTAKNTV
jgi:cobalt/nickel transport system permease protein